MVSTFTAQFWTAKQVASLVVYEDFFTTSDQPDQLLSSISTSTTQRKPVTDNSLLDVAHTVEVVIREFTDLPFTPATVLSEGLDSTGKDLGFLCLTYWNPCSPSPCVH